ncbi:MAG: DUF2064 domain-containing protein [Pseudomonadota bacterium]
MTAVAIFVKTPGYSPIKTRLASRIGQNDAESCHQRSAACVLDVVQRSGMVAYWAVAESEAIDHPFWQALPCVLQGEGSLGARMARVHTALVERHGSAILLGADLPQLQVQDLLDTREWLQGAGSRSVLGPARDGGFWLFGANQTHAESAWTSVRYSQIDTAQHFEQALGTANWMHLAKRCDIDTLEDLPQVIMELKQLPNPSALQREVAAWLAQWLDD